MYSHIERLMIEGFRSLNGLSLRGLGHVNLFTGRNNSGKSSLLEAVRILASGGSTRIIYEILDGREEVGTRYRGVASAADTSVCSLFSGFPLPGSESGVLSISARGRLSSQLSEIQMRLAYGTRVNDIDGQTFKYEITSGDLFGDTDSIPVLEIRSNNRRRILPVQRFSDRMGVRASAEYQGIPCVYLSPFGSRSSTEMSSLWDAIALTDIEDEIVRALKIVAPEVSAVSMVGDDAGSRRGRIAIARSRVHDSPVPLKSFGDGVNRIFSIILSLANARSGILLVDEIENGIHYTAQAELWSIIFDLARRLDVQVFATTHSWDCIDAFQSAAQDSPKEGVLVRLRQGVGAVHATSFSEKELEIVTRDRIEVR